jgi:hypothetical protein
MLTQWIALAAIILVLFGLAFAFSRKGLTIKPDPDNKPPSNTDLHLH